MSFGFPTEAAEDFLEHLREAFRCVFEQVHLKAPPRIHDRPNDVHTVMLNNGLREPLPREAEPPLAATFILYIQVVREADGRFRVTTSGYSYIISVRTQTGYPDLLVWQWDQRGEVSTVTYPHLHVNAFNNLLPGAMHSFHLPTGRVLIEDVLEFCIVDLGVKERRTDWRDVLNHNRQRQAQQ